MGQNMPPYSRFTVLFYWSPALLALPYLILNEEQSNGILIGIFVASCIHSENAQFMGLQKGRRSKYSCKKKIAFSSCALLWMVSTEWAIVVQSDSSSRRGGHTEHDQKLTDPYWASLTMGGRLMHAKYRNYHCHQDNTAQPFGNQTD